MFEHRAEPAEARVTLDEGQRTYDLLALPPDASGDALLVIADVTADGGVGARSANSSRSAHQLRTPVSAIASAIEVIQGGAKEDRRRATAFSRISTGSARGSSV